MHETEIIKYFEKAAVFSLADVNQVINNRDYAKKFLKKIVKSGKIFKIKRNSYSFYKDSFLASTFLVKPSYISSVSALSHYGLITQIPNEVFSATLKKSSRIKSEIPINYFHTDYFFGFRKEKYENFEILIAEPEKAIIDSLSIVPVSVIEEAFENINNEKMIELLIKIKKSSIVKRIGYLMEKNKYKVYAKLKDFINYKYIPLDPLLGISGKKDEKWGLIINSK